MLNRTGVIASTALLLVLGSVRAQTPTKYPAAVDAKIAELAKDCHGFGKFEASPGFVTVADLTGDGVPDYILDEGRIGCKQAASMFQGSLGFSVEIFAGSAKGGAAEAFSHGVVALHLDEHSKPATLYLAVGGPLCGQHVTPDTPFADMESCWRPVRWNAATRKMELSPLSAIKPFDYFK